MQNKHTILCISSVCLCYSLLDCSTQTFADKSGGFLREDTFVRAITHFNHTLTFYTHKQTERDLEMKSIKGAII